MTKVSSVSSTYLEGFLQLLLSQFLINLSCFRN